MCKVNGFDEARMRSGCEKLSKAREVKPQGRLDTFFSKLPGSGPPKRKADPKGKGKGKDAKKVVTVPLPFAIPTATQFLHSAFPQCALSHGGVSR